MMDFLNNITVSVSRRSAISKTPTYGEPVYSSQVIYANIRARYDDYGGSTHFNEQGERVASTRKILLDTIYPVQEEDIITISFDNIPRRVIKVVPDFGVFGSDYANEITLLDP